MFSISVPLPGFDDATVKELKKWLDGYKQAAEGGPIRGGVSVEGDAAAYALVWEWGNARQTKEGPKTVKGINPDGESVWLSVQAPFGYIGLHEPDYINILQRKLSQLDFSEAVTAKDIRDEMKRASYEAAERIADLIKQHVPVDSGELQDSIAAMDPNDPDLETEDDEIELGNSAFGHQIRRQLKKLKG